MLRTPYNHANQRHEGSMLKGVLFHRGNEIKQKISGLSQQLTAIRLADPSGADFMRILAAETDCMARPFPSTIRISTQSTRKAILSSTTFITLKQRADVCNQPIAQGWLVFYANFSPMTNRTERKYYRKYNVDMHESQENFGKKADET